MTAGRDLALAATGPITISAAQERDSSQSSNRSSGFSAGVEISQSGITPTGSVNIGRGNSSGTAVTNIESTLSAGGTATVVTPEALTLRGSTLNADQVNVQAGALTIESLQDSEAFRQRQTNVGVTVSAANGGTVSGNLTSSRVNEQFDSVVTQAGINAGASGGRSAVNGSAGGGFTIDVQGRRQWSKSRFRGNSRSCNRKIDREKRGNNVSSSTMDTTPSG